MILAAGLFWDRATVAGLNWATDWVVDRASSDISDRVADAEDSMSHLPEPRQFDSRAEYLDALNAYNREFLTAMGRISALLSNPRLQDDDWSEDVAEQIAVIRHLESRAEAMGPPNDTREVHEHWVSSVREYRRAMDSTASALDNLSPTELVEAIASMERATESYESMRRSLDELE